MKKVLIVTYYWPPSGGIGVHRCLKFAKYLRCFGWEPVIYTALDAQYPYFDQSNQKHVPKDLTVLKQPIIEPFNLFKRLTGRKKHEAMSNPVHVREPKNKLINQLSIWIRGNFFIPDARCLWIKPSVRYLTNYLKNNPVDAILSDGPPHTNTAIACKVSQKTNTPWLADFQDPWTQVDYYKFLKLTRWADNKHRRMEQESFKTARKITIASPTWGKDLESIGATNVSPVFWGYDEDDFNELEQNLHTKFSISHAGILGFDRKPDTLFKVLHDLKNETEKFAEDLELLFAGMIDYSVKESLKQHKLEENTNLPGTISRPEALKLTLNSQLLLLPLNKTENAKGRIPGKLFECMRSHRPILCLGPNGSDVEQIITGCNAGESFEYDDYEGLKNFITKYYRQFQKNKIKNINNNINQYSVKNQTRKIADYLNEISNN